MKRYDRAALDGQFPIAAEPLQLQVREVTPVMPLDRQFAIRDALLERFSSDTGYAPSASLHPRGNA